MDYEKLRLELCEKYKNELSNEKKKKIIKKLMITLTILVGSWFSVFSLLVLINYLTLKNYVFYFFLAIVLICIFILFIAGKIFKIINTKYNIDVNYKNNILDDVSYVIGNMINSNIGVSVDRLEEHAVRQKYEQALFPHEGNLKCLNTCVYGMINHSSYEGDLFKISRDNGDGEEVKFQGFYFNVDLNKTVDNFFIVSKKSYKWNTNYPLEKNNRIANNLFNYSYYAYGNIPYGLVNVLNTLNNNGKICDISVVDGVAHIRIKLDNFNDIYYLNKYNFGRIVHELYLSLWFITMFVNEIDKI